MSGMVPLRSTVGEGPQAMAVSPLQSTSLDFNHDSVLNPHWERPLIRLDGALPRTHLCQSENLRRAGDLVVALPPSTAVSLPSDDKCPRQRFFGIWLPCERAGRRRSDARLDSGSSRRVVWRCHSMTTDQATRRNFRIILGVFSSGSAALQDDIRLL
jgi:hypothetical protein